MTYKWDNEVMEKFTLFYPVKLLYVNQPFGANAGYYSKFLDPFGNPMQGHMGIDFMAGHGQPVYAPHDGLASYKVDSHGGDGIYLRTPNFFDSGDGGQCYFMSILWHLCPVNDPDYPIKIRTDGGEQAVKAGDLLGYADNTGAPYESTGDHLHMGLFRVNSAGMIVNPGNGFGGAINPAPFLNGFYAEDAQKLFGYYSALVVALQKLAILK